MPEYLAPGVYVEEVSSGIKPIEGVSTSTAGFLGRTERGPDDAAYLVTSFTEYQRIFGGFLDQPEGMYLPDAVKGFFDNGGRRAFIARACNARLGRAIGTVGTSGIEVEAIGAGTWGTNVYVLLHRSEQPGSGDRYYRLTIAYFARPQLNWVNPLASAQNLLIAGLSRPRPDYFEDFDGLKSPKDIESTVNDRSQLIRISKMPVQLQPAPEVALAEARLHWSQLQASSEDLKSILQKSDAATQQWARAAAAARRSAEATRAAADVAGKVAEFAKRAEALGDIKKVPAEFKTAVTESTGEARAAAGKILSGSTKVRDSASQVGAALEEAKDAENDARAASENEDDKKRDAAQAAVDAANKAATAAEMATKEVADELKPALVNAIQACKQAATKAAQAKIVAEKVQIVGAAEGAKKTIEDIEKALENVIKFPDDIAGLKDATSTVTSRVTAAAKAAEDAVADGTDIKTAKGKAEAAADEALASKLSVEKVDQLVGLESQKAKKENDDARNEENPKRDPDYLEALKKLEEIDGVSIVIAPEHINDDLQGLDVELDASCRRLADRVVLLSVTNKNQYLDADKIRLGNIDSSYAAFYHPWIEVADPTAAGPGLKTKTVPVIGHIAGICARTDVTRGVHKAPANEVVIGALDLPVVVGKGQQDILNPRGVNCIRDFRPDGRGLRLWGARTTSSDPEWKYLNVRRLFLFLEESIDQGTQWVVFEPNSDPTWAAVRQNISNFLLSVWRSGALLGTKPEEAFFVRCDRTTMTEDDILNGRLICVIGVAPVRPAEFVIIRISQMTAEAKA